MSSAIVPELYGEEYSLMHMIQSLHEINQDLKDHLEKGNSEGKELCELCEMKKNPYKMPGRTGN